MGLLLQHLGNTVFAAQKDRLGVDAHRRVPDGLVGFVDLGWMAGFKRDSSIIDQATLISLS